MNSNKLYIFDILEQIHENSYQLSKCYYKKNNCLIICVYVDKSCKSYISNNIILYKDLNTLYNILYNNYMSTIINNASSLFEEEFDDIKFFKITELTGILDKSTII